MLFIIISIITAIIAGSGIGGGSIFILLITAFNLLDYKTTMVYNLIMFVVVGITATINNIKSKKFDKKIFFKIIIFCLIGSYIGVYFAKIVDEVKIKKYFYIFILIIGIYEIISSLISFKKGKL
jgi:uncharacterized membrane protein YfcA